MRSPSNSSTISLNSESSDSSCSSPTTSPTQRESLIPTPTIDEPPITNPTEDESEDESPDPEEEGNKIRKKKQQNLVEVLQLFVGCLTLYQRFLQHLPQTYPLPCILKMSDVWCKFAAQLYFTLEFMFNIFVESGAVAERFRIRPDSISDLTLDTLNKQLWPDQIKDLLLTHESTEKEYKDLGESWCTSSRGRKSPHSLMIQRMQEILKDFTGTAGAEIEEAKILTILTTTKEDIEDAIKNPRHPLRQPFAHAEQHLQKVVMELEAKLERIKEYEKENKNLDEELQTSLKTINKLEAEKQQLTEETCNLKEAASASGISLAAFLQVNKEQTQEIGKLITQAMESNPHQSCDHKDKSNNSKGRPYHSRDHQDKSRYYHSRDRHDKDDYQARSSNRSNWNHSSHTARSPPKHNGIVLEPSTKKKKHSNESRK